MKCKSVLLGGKGKKGKNEPEAEAEDQPTTATSASGTGLPDVPEASSANAGLPPVSSESAKATPDGAGLPEIPPVKAELKPAPEPADPPKVPEPKAEEPSEAKVEEPPKAKVNEPVKEKDNSASKIVSSFSSSSSSSWSSSSGGQGAAVGEAETKPGLPPVELPPPESKPPNVPQPKADTKDTKTDVETPPAIPSEPPIATKESAAPPAAPPAVAPSPTTDTVEASPSVSTDPSATEAKGAATPEVNPSPPPPPAADSPKAEAAKDKPPEEEQPKSSAKESVTGPDPETQTGPTSTEEAKEEESVTASTPTETDAVVDESYSSDGEGEQMDQDQAEAEDEEHEETEESENMEVDEETDETEASDFKEEAEPSETEAQQEEQTTEEIAEEESATESVGEPAHTGIAAVADEGRLASWEKSIGTATGGITPKEKVAIGIGCAGVAVFAILLVWALLNRHKVSQFLKRRSWSSVGSGRQSLKSEPSWTVSDWEKMGQNRPGAPAASGIAELNAHPERRTQQQQSPPRQHPSIYAASSRRSERDNEELGYDWLELASEGNRGVSVHTLAQQQQYSRFSSSPRKRSFVAQSMLSSPGIIAKAFRIIVPDDKKAPHLQAVPTEKKKGRLNVILRLPSMRSPTAKSPLGSGRRMPDGTSPTGNPFENAAAVRTARTPRSLPKDIRNPFEDPPGERSPSSRGQMVPRQTALPYAQAHLSPQRVHGADVAGASPYQQRGLEAPLEIEYVSPSAPRSSISGSSSEGSSRVLALPGGQTPPMSPLRPHSGRAVPSMLSEAEGLYSQMSVHLSTQRTMDFRRFDTMDDGGMEREETYPEDASRGEEGGYEVNDDDDHDDEGGRDGTTSLSFSNSNHNDNSNMESWYTRTLIEPPSLLDAVPITQEEVRKSRARNTVRFAE